MRTAKSPASNEVVTAALLVIGSKILSGRTKDQNIGYVAEYLTAAGIDLKEVRVVGDEERLPSAPHCWSHSSRVWRNPAMLKGRI
jgi:molybdopterin biosynthesis enzyme MoaB